MDFQELLIKYSPFLKKNILALSLGFLGMIFFIYGLIWLLFTNKTASENIVFEDSSEKNSSEIKAIFVDIGGAVVIPGLYKLPHDSRIQDGLVAAGGLAAQADREHIEKNLNLATRLTDGAKIYILALGEPKSNTGVSSAGQVNINSASEQELDGLPGIGPVTAQKIINGRPYGSVDEILNKKIVGSKVFSQIREKITVY